MERSEADFCSASEISNVALNLEENNVSEEETGLSLGDTVVGHDEDDMRDHGFSSSPKLIEQSSAQCATIMFAGVDSSAGKTFC
jgi:hypothetical protein